MADAPRIKSACSTATDGLHADGRSCCNTRADRRRAKRPVKRGGGARVARRGVGVRCVTVAASSTVALVDVSEVAA
jgi:hypothetical protein